MYRRMSYNLYSSKNMFVKLGEIMTFYSIIYHQNLHLLIMRFKAM